MAGEESVLQDSVVTGDLHVGDVTHNTQHHTQHTTNHTHIDQSTNISMPNMENVGEKVVKAASAVGESSKNAVGEVGKFVQGIINRVLLFATVTVLVTGFLVYNGSIDANELIRRM